MDVGAIFLKKDYNSRNVKRKESCFSTSDMQKRFLKHYLFIYFWLCWVFFAACGLSLVAESGSCSLVAVHGLLIAVASLVAEHRL